MRSKQWPSPKMAKIWDQEKMNWVWWPGTWLTNNSGKVTGSPYFQVTKPMPIALSGHMVCSKVFTCMREYFLTSLLICALLAPDSGLMSARLCQESWLLSVFHLSEINPPPYSLTSLSLPHSSVLPSYRPKLLSGLGLRMWSCFFTYEDFSFSSYSSWASVILYPSSSGSLSTHVVFDLNSTSIESLALCRVVCQAPTRPLEFPMNPSAISWEDTA